jgi:hypothetical protein
MVTMPVPQAVSSSRAGLSRPTRAAVSAAQGANWIGPR